LRGEDTEFEISNATLGLSNSKIDNQGLTFSGSANYAIPVNENGLTFIPTIGFGITENDTDTLNFSGGEALAFEDFQSRTGFIGATLAKTTVSANGLAATNIFGTATAYTDFNRSRTSTFTSGGVSQQLVTDGIGTFGEISLGVNHVKILDGSGSSNARQLSASARLDYRFNSDIDSFGLTAQVRLQF
jgi:outer membrane autotransporter protein